jgi:murein tripeptide amidase MpaA
VKDYVLTDEDAKQQRRVWALIFNYRSENEGIYTQSIDGREHVLMWQAEEDAARYGDMLTDAQDFPGGTTVEMETSTLLEYCKEAGHVPCLIPSSSVVIPPDANVEEFDWTLEELEEGSLNAQEMTEENLRRRRKELEAMLGKGMDPDANAVREAD